MGSHALRHSFLYLIILLSSSYVNATSFIGPKTTECPSLDINQVVKDPTVQAALDDAWSKSNEGTANEVEAGSWVYQCRELPQSGSQEPVRYYTMVLPIVTGERDGLGLGSVPRVSKCRVVATFHTHPGPAVGGTFDNGNPSPEDVFSTVKAKVPEIIRYGTGNNTTDFTYGYKEVAGPPSDIIITRTDDDGSKTKIYADKTTEARQPQWRCPSTTPTPSLHFNASCQDPDTRSFEFTNETATTQSYEAVSSLPENLIVTTPPFDLEPGETRDVEVMFFCTCACSPRHFDGEVTVSLADANANNTEPLEIRAMGSCPALAGCGGSAGDPHLWTPDGVRFDFQGAGEYVLTRALSSNFEVQVRMIPYGKSISVNQAVAVRLGSNRVAIYAGTKELLFVNGKPTNLQTGDSLKLPGAGSVTRENGVFYIRSDKGEQVNVMYSHSFLNVYFFSAGAVEGLIASSHTSESREFRASDGARFSAPFTVQQFYRQFGDSWLVVPANSLFDYFNNEESSDFHIADFPEQFFKLADLSAETTAKAQDICRAYSVPEGHAMETCIFDVGITGDNLFAALASAGLTNTESHPAGTAKEASNPDNRTASLQAPEAVGAGASFTVTWEGPGGGRDLITVALRDAPALKFDNYARTNLQADESVQTVTLRAPEEPGNYQLRYVTAHSKKILATLPLESTAVSASLEAPRKASAGSPVAINWDGPGNDGDFITVATANESPREYENFAYAKLDSEAETQSAILRAPEEPGSYELRYVTARDRKTLATLPLESTAVSASLEAPRKASAGSPVAITWDGPGNDGDFITVATANESPREYDNYAFAKLVTEAETQSVILRVPEEPGSYELRYVTAHDRKILTTRPLESTPVSASLETPEQAPAGSPIAVIWNGPGNSGDMITVALVDDSPRKYENYTFAKLNPDINEQRAALRAPDEPGRYELRYVTAHNGKILATRPLKSTAVTASLEVPKSIIAGNTFTVIWSGPGNNGDVISVALPNDSSRIFANYAFAKRNPETQEQSLKLRAPEEPGRYEVRYLTSQKRNILQRATVEVTTNDK